MRIKSAQNMRVNNLQWKNGKIQRMIKENAVYLSLYYCCPAKDLHDRRTRV